MKKILVTLILLSSFLKAQTNTLLNGDFWKKNPPIEVVKEEILKGNNPAEANGGNHDVVSMAINNGADYETIVYLIEKPGNSVTKNTHDGRQYIHWAAMRGDLEVVDYLISKGSDLNRTDDKGATPLTFAAGFGQNNPELFEKFFKAGINPKQKYADGASVLLLAISNDKDLKLTDYLVTKGLSLKDTDDNGRTAFDYAARTGDVAFLKTLAQKGIKPTGNALIFASQGTRFASNKIDTYKYLIEDVKLNPNSKGLNGENALHNVVRKKDQTEIINYLISKGVDVNAVDKEGNNVLFSAAGTNNLDVVKTIVSKIKDINAVNAKGETALFSAVQHGSPEVMSYLIEKGAKTTLNAKDGNLAFYLVQSYRAPRPGQASDFAEKLAILKNKGVKLNATDKDGNSLLHIAVAKNDLNLLKSLAALNLDINTQNKDGMTALHRAALIAKDDVIMKDLIATGAKKELKTEFDETAFDLASENESLKENNVNINFLK
jgi:ankyrin repeat protein